MVRRIKTLQCRHSDTKEEERKRAERNRKCALQEQTQTGEGDGLLKAAREGGREGTRDLKDLRGGGRERESQTQKERDVEILKEKAAVLCFSYCPQIQ